MVEVRFRVRFVLVPQRWSRAERTPGSTGMPGALRADRAGRRGAVLRRNIAEIAELYDRGQRFLADPGSQCYRHPAASQPALPATRSVPRRGGVAARLGARGLSCGFPGPKRRSAGHRRRWRMSRPGRRHARRSQVRHPATSGLPAARPAMASNGARPDRSVDSVSACSHAGRIAASRPTCCIRAVPRSARRCGAGLKKYRVGPQK